MSGRLRLGKLQIAVDEERGLEIWSADRCDSQHCSFCIAMVNANIYFTFCAASINGLLARVERHTGELLALAVCMGKHPTETLIERKMQSMRLTSLNGQTSSTENSSQLVVKAMCGHRIFPRKGKTDKAPGTISIQNTSNDFFTTTMVNSASTSSFQDSIVCVLLAFLKGNSSAKDPLIICCLLAHFVVLLLTSLLFDGYY